jgi:hydrogenase-4 membrane subunit HyfE
MLTLRFTEKEYEYLFFLLLVMPLIIYIGYKRSSTNDFIYGISLMMSIILLLHHSTKAIRYLEEDIDEGQGFRKHMFRVIIAVLFIYLSYIKNNVDVRVFDAIYGLGVAGASYYGYLLLKNLKYK